MTETVPPRDAQAIAQWQRRHLIGLAGGAPLIGLSAALPGAAAAGAPNEDAPALDARAFGVQIDASGSGLRDQSAALQAAIDAASRLGKPLLLPAGRIGIGRPVTVQPSLRLAGAGSNATRLVHLPGVATAMFRLAPGPVSGVHLSDFGCEGNGAPGEHGLHLWAQPDPAPPFHGGLWYATLERLVFQFFGGKSLWFQGGALPERGTLPSNHVHQFITIRDTVVFRGEDPRSRALSVTGKCGQFYFEGFCEFDARVDGRPQLPGLNVCFSREFRNRQSGAYGDAGDARDLDTLAARPDWAPTPLPGRGQPRYSDEACYGIDFRASVQGSYHGIWVDRGSVFAHHCYFEALYRAALVLNGNLCLTDSVFNNAATLNPPLRDDGAGYIAATTENGFLMVGSNILGGAAGASYRRIGSGHIQRASADRVGTRTAADALSSLTSVQASIDRGVLRAGAAADLFVSAGLPIDLHTIESELAPGSRLIVRPFEPPGGVLRIVGGGNIACAEIAQGRPLLLRVGDAVTLYRGDGLGTWIVVGRSIAPLAALERPGQGYFAAGEVVQNLGRSSVEPANGKLLTGWARTSDGTTHRPVDWQPRFALSG